MAAEEEKKGEVVVVVGGGGGCGGGDESRSRRRRHLKTASFRYQNPCVCWENVLVVFELEQKRGFRGEEDGWTWTRHFRTNGLLEVAGNGSNSNSI